MGLRNLFDFKKRIIIPARHELKFENTRPITPRELKRLIGRELIVIDKENKTNTTGRLRPTRDDTDKVDLVYRLSEEIHILFHLTPSDRTYLGYPIRKTPEGNYILVGNQAGKYLFPNSPGYNHHEKFLNAA